jgi:hypothetical protein
VPAGDAGQIGTDAPADPAGAAWLGALPGPLRALLQPFVESDSLSGIGRSRSVRIDPLI